MASIIYSQWFDRMIRGRPASRTQEHPIGGKGGSLVEYCNADFTLVIHQYQPDLSRFLIIFLDFLEQILKNPDFSSLLIIFLDPKSDWNPSQIWISALNLGSRKRSGCRGMRWPPSAASRMKWTCDFPSVSRRCWALWRSTIPSRWKIGATVWVPPFWRKSKNWVETSSTLLTSATWREVGLGPAMWTLSIYLLVPTCRSVGLSLFPYFFSSIHPCLFCLRAPECLGSLFHHWSISNESNERAIAGKW